MFVGGDITDTGNANEYEKMWDIVEIYEEDLSVYLVVGNHDLVLDENEGKLFLCKKSVFQQCTTKNNSWLSLPIYERQESGKLCVFSEQQLKWLEDMLNSCREEDDAQLAFLFVHQPLSDTVAGSLPEQDWDGISEENNCVWKI